MSAEVKLLKDIVTVTRAMHLPVVLRSTCPGCLEPVVRDYREEMVLQNINKPFKINFYHRQSKCKRQWSEVFIFRAAIVKHHAAVFNGWETRDKGKSRCVRAYRDAVGCTLMEAKSWVEDAPHNIDKELASKLDQIGALIHWVT